MRQTTSLLHEHDLLRMFLLALVAVAVSLAVVATLRYPRFLATAGANAMIAPVVLLAVYAVAIIAATGDYAPADLQLLPAGTFIGFIVGAVECVHIAQENFADVDSGMATATTGAAMFSIAVLFALAGSRAARRGASLPICVAAGVWSAMIGLLIAATFGLTLLNVSPATLEARNVGSPDFVRSGWTDLRAFTIADVFESAVKVLVVGPILGAIFGGTGGGIEHLLRILRKQNPL